MDRKLKLFGHISRMDDNRLVKVVVFGMINGKTSEEDQARNGSMTSKNGARQTFTLSSKNAARLTFTLSSAWHRIDHNGGGMSTKHWTPTARAHEMKKKKKN